MTKINQSQGQQIRVDRESHHVLRQGAKSAEVAHLQRLLASAGEGGSVTGKFDARTFAAVREYQRTRGLQVDGVVGPETWGSLSRKNEPPVPFRRALPTDKSRAVDGFGVDEASRQVAALGAALLRARIS